MEKVEISRRSADIAVRAMEFYATRSENWEYVKKPMKELARVLGGRIAENGCYCGPEVTPDAKTPPTRTPHD